MLNMPSSVRVFLCVLPVDMRRSFDTLAEMVRLQMGEEPLSGHLFLFRNKEEDKLEVLWWDRDGYAIFYKRLEKGRFALPQAVGGSLEMDATTFSMLLHGLDGKIIRRQERYSPGAPAGASV